MSDLYLNQLEAPGKDYPRIPNRILDMRDFEVNTSQSKSYNFKQYQKPLVRESETGIILFQESIIHKPMIGGDETVNVASPTTYNTANGNEFNFSRYYGNDANWNYLGQRSSSASYIVGDVVNLVNGYYYCIQNNSNQTPPNLTYWIQVGSGQLSNLSIESLGSNIIEVVTSGLVEINFGFVMSLDVDIAGITATITSDVNGNIMQYVMSGGSVVPLLSDSMLGVSGSKNMIYYATQGELLEYEFTIVPDGGGGTFTLIGDQTYWTIKSLRPNR